MALRWFSRRLPYTAKFGDLIDGKLDRRLNTTVGILLQPVAHLNETDRRKRLINCALASES